MGSCASVRSGPIGDETGHYKSERWPSTMDCEKDGSVSRIHSDGDGETDPDVDQKQQEDKFDMPDHDDTMSRSTLSLSKLVLSQTYLMNRNDSDKQRSVMRGDSAESGSVFSAVHSFISSLTSQSNAPSPCPSWALEDHDDYVMIHEKLTKPKSLSHKGDSWHRDKYADYIVLPSGEVKLRKSASSGTVNP